MESFFTTNKIYNLIIKWKVHLISLVIIASIFAVVFSSEFFIEPKYESNAVVYPAFEITYSDASETEQMIEILLSKDIMFKVIEAFNLDEHYDISKDDRNFTHRLIRTYQSNVNIQKTSNEAVQISVRDKDPDMAAKITQSIIDFYNDKVLNLNKEKSIELVKIFREEKIKKKNEIDSLAGAITDIRKKYGILHMPSQVEVFSEATYLGRGISEANKILNSWKKMGAEYQKTDSLFNYALNDLHEIKIIYESAVRDTQKVQTYAHVVSNPFPNDKKVYPVRWAICLLSAIGAFLIGLIIIAFIESNRAKKD